MTNKKANNNSVQTTVVELQPQVDAPKVEQITVEQAKAMTSGRTPTNFKKVDGKSLLYITTITTREWTHKTDKIAKKDTQVVIDNDGTVAEIKAGEVEHYAGEVGGDIIVIDAQTKYTTKSGKKGTKPFSVSTFGYDLTRGDQPTLFGELLILAGLVDDSILGEEDTNASSFDDDDFDDDIESSNDIDDEAGVELLDKLRVSDVIKTKLLCELTSYIDDKGYEKFYITPGSITRYK